jgi:hypothetical protein
MPKLKEVVASITFPSYLIKFLSVYYRLNNMKLRKSEEFELNELIK